MPGESCGQRSLAGYGVIKSWTRLKWLSTHAHTLLLFCCSVAKLCSTLCDCMECSTPGFPVLYYYLTIPSSVALFSFCLQSFPASASFPVSWPSPSGSQSIGASTSASVLPMNIQDWFPLRLTGLISLQSRGLSSLLQHHSSKALVLCCSAFFMVQLS